MSRPLRVAVLLDDWTQPRWVLGLLERLRGEVRVSLDLAILRDGAPRPTASPLVALHRRIDRRFFGRPDDALATADARPLLGGVATRGLPAHDRRDVARRDAYAAIAERDLDVLVDLGQAELEGGLLELARYGVWRHRLGGDLAIPGQPAGTWEVALGRPTLEVVVEQVLPGGRRRVLARSIGRTWPRSPRRCAERAYWKSAALVPRLLRDLHARGEAALESAEPAGSGAGRRPPTDLEVLAHGARALGRYAREKADALRTTERWVLLAHLADRPGDAPSGPESFATLEPPPGRLWADPFPVEHGGTHFVFLEACGLERGARGALGVFELDAAGRPGAVETILERPYHLSYPHVFEWRGERFMTPESGAARHLELHRCVDFPGAWTLEAEMLPGVELYDPTPFELGGRWWLFATVAEPGADSCDELHLFSAASPVGPWEPHPRNPVVSDARRARPAGRVFRAGGRLLRPAQDCTGRYGRAIVIHEVLELTAASYREREVFRIEPGARPDLVATHTLNRAGRLTMLDAVRRTRR